MSRLSSERKVLRSLFTKKANNIEEFLQDGSNLEAITPKKETLNAIFNKLHALDEQILQELMSREETREEDIEKEISSTFDYTERFHEVSEEIKRLHAHELSDKLSNKSLSSSSAVTKLRLPKIELKKFDGEIKNWIGFWSQFSKIHNDENLIEEDKFDYLLQCMKSGSPVQKLIEGFPSSKENYSKAIELLKSRYGKDEFLIEYYTRELLSLVLKRQENLTVTYLYDKLEVQLRALDSLGVTKEKYAAMLFPLVESAMPENIFRVWERHRVGKNASTREPDNCLMQLLDFLKTEVEAEERLKLRVGLDSLGTDNDTKIDCKQSKFIKPKSSLPSAAVLVTSENNKVHNVCIFCSKASHQSHDCFSLVDKSVSERQELVKKKGVCFKCLKKGHLVNKCKVPVKCHFCKGNHLAILCNKTQSSATDEKEQCRNAEFVHKTTASFSGVGNQGKISPTYLQTLTACLDCYGQSRKVRILCDSGSQKSFISSKCVQELGMQTNRSITIQQQVFGGKKTKPKRQAVHSITLRSLSSEFMVNVEVLEQPVICNQIPKVCDKQIIKLLEQENIILSDVGLSDSADDFDSVAIDVLLGANVWAQIITPEFYKLNKQLVAIKTQLGWTLIGSAEGETSSLTTMFVSSTSLPPSNVQTFWDLETMGILDPSSQKRKEERDEQVVDHFNKTVKINSNGRYTVKLPWIEDCPPLESNRKIAENRLNTTIRRLNITHLYTDYDKVFRDWLDQDIIETVGPGKTCVSSHYLPHRPVVKEGSTTRIRPVFDASNKDKNGYSVNSCLETGPNLIELIPKVLTSFRTHVYALTADVEKAFLQINIDRGDRDMLRFLWWENERIIEYRHTRVVFGLSCSPFLLGAVLNNLLENCPIEFKPIAEKLKTAFYVDNCLTGVDSIEDQDHFISKAKSLLQLGCFNLRGWVGNGFPSSEDTTENVLGLKWNCSKDELYCSVSNINMKPNVLTRRTLLSCAQRIFDPIGLTAPVSLVPKIILQKTWSLKIGWDDELPEDLKIMYNKWVKTLACLDKCTMPRKITLNDTSTLHVFCDASKNAFGTCIFLRTEVHGQVEVKLILGKSRVSPTKQLTLPRLELMGALTGVRLCSLAIQCLSKTDLPITYWLDSTVALTWISKQGKWSLFVENRVNEIKKHTVPSQWRYVPGHDNPADLMSRGCTPEQLSKSEWWNGPEWLHEPPEHWPTENPLPDMNLVEDEKRKTVTTVSNVESTTLADTLGIRISRFSTIVRTIARILRLTPKNKRHLKHEMSSAEYKEAEKVLFKLIQKDVFSGDTKNKLLSGIETFIDTDGIIRLKSRLLNQDYSQEYIYPVILPSNHIVVDRMIEEYHIHHKHAGVQTLLVALREQVWILKGRKTIGRVIHKCIPCKRHSAVSLEAPAPPLPKDRTKLSSCFQVTGIDLAGPLFTRDTQKCWVVVFTCAVYRAVHLELVSSISTEAFILALRRFIARRGRVKIIYTDNGTNFVGLNNKLKKIDWNKMETEFQMDKIQWKFNPPAAPWWGGFWERLIRIMKGLLRRNLGNASLNYEELNTLICECEGVMNNRPLTYVSEETNELKPLTPAMFIQSLQGNDVMDLDLLESTSLQKRWNYLQRIRSGLRTRFKKEYLGFLRSSKKNRVDTIDIGDVVLINKEDKRRITWPLGKVIDILPGKDNITRLVKLQTKDGVLLRPIQRLYPLEIKDHEENLQLNTVDINQVKATSKEDTLEKSVEEPITNTEEDTSKESYDVPLQLSQSGRQIKKPIKLDL